MIVDNDGDDKKNYFIYVLLVVHLVVVVDIHIELYVSCCFFSVNIILTI